MNQDDAYTSGLGPPGNWRVGAIGYVLIYVAGTVVGDLATAERWPLVVPAVAIGALLWAADASGRVPRHVTGLAGLLLPFIVAAVVIAVTA